MYIHSNQTSN